MTVREINELIGRLTELASIKYDRAYAALKDYERELEEKYPGSTTEEVGEEFKSFSMTIQPDTAKKEEAEYKKLTDVGLEYKESCERIPVFHRGEDRKDIYVNWVKVPALNKNALEDACVDCMFVAQEYIWQTSDAQRIRGWISRLYELRVKTDEE